MVVHRGTHGTCEEWASQIVAEGFKPSSTGKVGSGVYFWTYEDDPDMARDLAFGWVKSGVKRNAYSPISPTTCGVIFTEVVAPEDECLDCTTQSFVEHLNRFLKRLEKIDDTDLSTAYDTLIKEVEAASGAKFTVIYATVSIPRGMAFKQKIFVGNPAIHVVRDKFDQIKVVNCERHPLATQQ